MGMLTESLIPQCPLLSRAAFRPLAIWGHGCFCHNWELSGSSLAEMPCSHPILGVLPLPGYGTPFSNFRTPTMSPIPGGNQFQTLPSHFSPLSLLSPPPPAKLSSIISSESSGFSKVWKSFDAKQCLRSAPAKNTPEACNQDRVLKLEKEEIQRQPPNEDLKQGFPNLHVLPADHDQHFTTKNSIENITIAPRQRGCLLSQTFRYLDISGKVYTILPAKNGARANVLKTKQNSQGI